MEENRKKNRKEVETEKILEILNKDTGFNFKCIKCKEFKGYNSCTKYKGDHEILDHTLMSKDQNYYLCSRCKKSTNNDDRNSFEIPEDFPVSLKEKLKEKCKYKDNIFADQKRFGFSEHQNDYIILNKLESFLIKPVIPFIRIGHCPRGRYLQVKGNVILISADVNSSINKILPQEQSLFPVSFKRKLSYEGYYLYEVIDKEKVIIYFNWLKKNNPLFFNLTLDDDSIDVFCHETKKGAEEFENLSQPQMVEPEDEINQEQMEIEIPLSSQYISAMMNKYELEYDDHTVAGKVADMIIDFQTSLGISDVVDEFEQDDCFFSSSDDDSSDEIPTKNSKRTEKVNVAPGEFGKFQNWGDDIFLEEKCFPNLFPYSKNGYLSTCIKEEKKLSFSQYVRSRIYSTDNRF